MRFNKFYNSLNDEQRKNVNKQIKAQIDVQKRNAMISRGLSWILVFAILFNMHKTQCVVYRDKTN